jgi:hypothetical protein
LPIAPPLDLTPSLLAVAVETVNHVPHEVEGGDYRYQLLLSALCRDRPGDLIGPQQLA